MSTALLISHGMQAARHSRLAVSLAAPIASPSTTSSARRAALCNKRLLHTTLRQHQEQTALSTPKATPAKRQTFNWLPYVSQQQQSPVAAATGNTQTKPPHASINNIPTSVKIVEVGPRDGLQNEPTLVPTAVKLELIQRLTLSGLSVIEATSFVSKKWVPQMGDNAEIMAGIHRMQQELQAKQVLQPLNLAAVSYPVLTPNMRGFESAVQACCKEVAVFAAASESFSQANINCSIAESLQRFEPVMLAAKQHDIRVRGYVSCVLGCPYDGPIAPHNVVEVTKALLQMGCYEVSLGDTIGIGNAGSTRTLLDSIADSNLPLSQLAVHFHDTYGQALANIYLALQYGIPTIDSSVSGLGGCPYAVGATGNVATEDVVYMLNGLGVHTGVDLQSLVETSWWISHQLQRTPTSRVSKALGSQFALKHA